MHGSSASCTPGSAPCRFRTQSPSTPPAPQSSQPCSTSINYIPGVTVSASQYKCSGCMVSSVCPSTLAFRGHLSALPNSSISCATDMIHLRGAPDAIRIVFSGSSNSLTTFFARYLLKPILRSNDDCCDYDESSVYMSIRPYPSVRYMM